MGTWGLLSRPPDLREYATPIRTKRFKTDSIMEDNLEEIKYYKDYTTNAIRGVVAAVIVAAIFVVIPPLIGLVKRMMNKGSSQYTVSSYSKETGSVDITAGKDNMAYS